MATSSTVIMEVRHLARGRGPVSKRLLQTALFPEGHSITLGYPDGQPTMTYDVQLRQISKPRSKWETVATVYPGHIIRHSNRAVLTGRGLKVTSG